MDLQYISLQVTRLFERVEGLGLYFVDVWSRDSSVGRSLEALMQHMEVTPPPHFEAHMSYVHIWKEQFHRDDGEGSSGVRQSDEDDE